MSDSISEKNDVHRLHLLLLVILVQLFVQVFSQAFEAGDLFIDFHFFIFNQKVDKNGILLLVGHAVLNVVHLELSFKLVIDHLLELFTIFEADESIVEDSEDLVTPQFDDLLFRFVVVLVSQEKSLEHLGDITHVVDVMCLRRCGQEISHALVEDVDSCDSQSVLEHLDVVAELVEFSHEDRLVDLAHLLLTWVSEVDQMEFRDKTWSNCSSTTTGLAHSGDQLKLAHVVLDNLLAVIPEA